MSPFAGMALVLVSLGALVLGVKAAQATGRLGAEGARKLVHMGMGCVCLCFPWIFATSWPVWLLVGLAGGALMALRSVPMLRARLGGVLHDVKRESWGEVYFPVGVAVVFTLSGGDALRFSVPVALLTFADAAGALVGKRWGRHHFETLEGCKSLEGSAAVGLVGALCVWVPLALAGTPVTTALLIAAVIGVFGMLMEAIAWRGLDNVFLPLAAFAQVSIYLGLADQLLLMRLVVLVAITAAAWFWRHGQLVDESARLGGALALYFFWSVGGWTWLVPPLVLLTTYARWMPAVPGGTPRHNLVAIICVASSGLVWTIAQALRPDLAWWWPFALGVAAQQAMITTVRFSQKHAAWPRAAWWLAGVTTTLLLQAAGAWLVLSFDVLFVPFAAVGAGALMLGTALFVCIERNLQKPERLALRWWRQGIIALLVSLFGIQIFMA